MAHGVQVTFDCADPGRLAAFWASARLFFQRVPEGKSAKNRVHLDVNVGRDRVRAEVERLVGEARQGWASASTG